MNRHNLISLIICLLAFCLISAPSLGAELTSNKVAKQKWFIANTSNFTVVSDSGKKKTIKLAQNLERFRSMFQLLTNTKLDSSLRPVKVYATKRAATYNHLAGYEKNLKNTSGFFSDTINGNYAVIQLGRTSEKFQLATLFHEYTHYLKSNLSSYNNPYWYNEGLAEHLGQTEFKDDQVVLFGKPVEHHLYNIAQMTWMPLETLLNATHIDSKNRKERYRIYSQGWLLVHFFESSPERSRQKAEFLLLLNKGVKPVPAIEQSTGMSIKDFEKELRKHAKKRKHKYSEITFKSPLKSADIQARKLSPDEALYHLGEFSLQTGRQLKLAKQYFEKALEINPKNVEALTGLANTYLGVDEQKMSELIEKAKLIEPKNPWLATISGHLNTWRVGKSQTDEDTKKYWNKAVRDFNTAINSGGPNTEALFSAASLYANEGRHDKALELLEHAFNIAPSNHTIRLSLIAQYFANNMHDEAELIAERVRRNHHMTDDGINKFEKWYSTQRVKAGLLEEQKSPSDARAA